MIRIERLISFIKKVYTAVQLRVILPLIGSAFVKSSGKDERSVNAIMGGSGINFKLVCIYIAMSKVNRTRGRTTDVHYYTHKSLIQKKIVL